MGCAREHLTKHTKGRIPTHRKTDKTPTPEIRTGEEEEEKRMMNGKHQLTHRFYNEIYLTKMGETPTISPNLPSVESNQTQGPMESKIQQYKTTKHTENEIKKTIECVKKQIQTPRN